jgi:multiple sugar transport system permease protein
MVLINSMKSTPEYYRDATPWLLPHSATQLISNLNTAWTTSDIGTGVGASALYGLVASALAIAFASLGAYSIARLRIRGRFFWFALVFSGTIFPLQMFLIPLFLLYQRTGLYDTQVGMICFYTSITIPFSLFVMRSFFATIPRELQEAARLDAGDFATFLWIFVPLARAPMAVLFLFNFTWIWNDLVFGLVLSASNGVRPITAGLAGLQDPFSTIGPPIVMAGALIATLPTATLFLLLSRYFTRGLVLTTGKVR